MAVVTFGGAYAVLAYVAQQAVETYQWLAPGEMLDGLGMAETTPGPLILVLQFVGFMGAFLHPGALDPMTAGVLGAALPKSEDPRVGNECVRTVMSRLSPSHSKIKTKNK